MVHDATDDGVNLSSPAENGYVLFIKVVDLIRSEKREVSVTRYNIYYVLK